VKYYWFIKTACEWFVQHVEQKTLGSRVSFVRIQATTPSAAKAEAIFGCYGTTKVVP
jgi:hypothetical protein